MRAVRLRGGGQQKSAWGFSADVAGADSAARRAGSGGRSAPRTWTTAGGSRHARRRQRGLLRPPRAGPRPPSLGGGPGGSGPGPNPRRGRPRALTPARRRGARLKPSPSRDPTGGFGRTAAALTVGAHTGLRARSLPRRAGVHAARRGAAPGAVPASEHDPADVFGRDRAGDAPQLGALGAGCRRGAASVGRPLHGRSAPCQPRRGAWCSRTPSSPACGPARTYGRRPLARRTCCTPSSAPLPSSTRRSRSRPAPATTWSFTTSTPAPPTQKPSHALPTTSHLEAPRPGMGRRWSFPRLRRTETARVDRAPLLRADRVSSVRARETLTAASAGRSWHR